MGTPLYNTDIIPLTSRPTLTVMDDGDYFAILDTSTGKISKILRTDVQKALKISYDNTTSGLTATQVQAALDELVVNLGSSDSAISALGGRMDTLEGDDTVEGSVAKSVKDAVEPIIEDVADHEIRIGATEKSLLTTKLAVNELERQSQIGNGATLDFSDIGIVPLDARATGRANPTVEGLTATNIVDGSGIANLGTVTFSSVLDHKYYDVLHGTVLTGTGSDMTITNDTGATDDIAVINLTSIYGAGNEPSEADCAKIFSYFDGTKSISMPARLRSVGRNLFDKSTVKVVNNSYYSITTGEVLQSINYFRLEGIKVPSGVISWALLVGVASRMFVYKGGMFTGNTSDSSSSSSSINTGDGDTVKMHFYKPGGFTQSEIDTVVDNLQVNIGSTATPYEPYQDSTLYIADNEEVRSIQDVQDTLTMVNGEYIYTKKVSTPVSVASGVAVNVTNYPTAKTGGKFAVELTAGGTQIGVIGTDSTSGAGTLRFELATPLTINLTTSGTLKAFQNGSVYFEPYYEGSHQTNASSQITLPYEGTIDKLTGYDENLEPYEVPSTSYTLVGTTLTVTGAEENEVFYVELSRAEPLAPEMTVNTLNNEQVIADTSNGKFYKLVPTITNGSLVIQTPVEVV